MTGTARILTIDDLQPAKAKPEAVLRTNAAIVIERAANGYVVTTCGMLFVFSTREQMFDWLEDHFPEEAMH